MAPHRARRELETSRHLPGRRALARFPHRLLEPLRERRLARQLQHLLPLHPTVRASDPVNLEVHRGLKLAPRQVSYRPFAQIVKLTELPPAAGALDLPVAPLPLYPQPQLFPALVDLVSVDPVAGPVENLREVVIGWHPASLAQPHESRPPHRFLRRAFFSLLLQFTSCGGDLGSSRLDNVVR